jgi:hypothetical protein
MQVIHDDDDFVYNRDFMKTYNTSNVQIKELETVYTYCTV